MQRVNSGSVTFSLSGGRQYVVDESYDYYIINFNLGDTVSYLTRDSISSNFSPPLIQNQNTFDSLFAGQYILSVRDSFGCVLDTILKL